MPNESIVHPADQLIPRRALWMLLLIVLGAAAVRVYTFNGFEGLDDAEYARFAYLFAEGRPFPEDYAGPAVFPNRLGVFVPTAMVFRWFGFSEWTSVLYPFVVSLASIVLAYFCAAVFFGWRAGLIAAALHGIYYWDIDSATKLLPDLPAAFFAGVGVTLVVALTRRQASSSQLLAGGLIAGAAFGAAWLSKESVAYLAPCCLVLMYLTVRRNGRSAWFLWGGLAVASVSFLLIEALSYYQSTGDLLFRFHEIERNYRQWENGFFTEGSDHGWAAGTSRPAAILWRLLASGPGTIFLDESFYYVPLVGLFATVYAWWRRDEAFLVPAMWFWSLAFMFNFMSSSLSAYVPLALFHRYLYPLYLPSIVLVSGLLSRTLLHNGHRPTQAEAAAPVRHTRLDVSRAVFGVVAALVILSAAVPRLYFTLTARHAAWAEEVRALHGSVSSETPVYADALTLRAFEFFAGYPQQTRWTSFEQLGSGEDVPAGSLVIVNKRYIDWLDRNAGMWVRWPGPGPTDSSGYRMHAFYKQAPNTWTTIWKNSNTQVYRVAGADTVPDGDNREFKNGEQQ